MLIVGHRGAPAAAPENTLPSFAAALEMGADAIETDLRLTLDDEIVLRHEDILPDGSSVSASTVPEVLAVAPGTPVLGELLALAAGRAALYLEVKPSADPAQRSALETVDRLVRMRSALHDVVVSSFDPDAAALARATLPAAVRTALTVSAWSEVEWAVETALQARHRECHIADALATPASIERIHAAGLRALVWTVNEPRRVLELHRAGADGVFTDDPAMALETLGRA